MHSCGILIKGIPQNDYSINPRIGQFPCCHITIKVDSARNCGVLIDRV